jgi:tRNA threonylcarbamoyladenosine biosynthesis protein TsaE
MQKTLLAGNADDTAQLARALAPLLMPGDTLLLSGEIGAGKTHFARSLILALLDAPEDVPSPTFTLVQTYEAPVAEIWHADLYRLTSADEAVELGLEEAFASAICLVEWPDRLEELAPASALRMAFEATEDDARNITLDWSDASWTARLEQVDL